MHGQTHLQSQILSTLNELDLVYADLWDISEQQGIQRNDLHRADEEYELENQFKRFADQIVIYCKAYIEMQGLTRLLDEFSAKASSFVESRKRLLAGEFDPEGMERYSSFTIFVRNYLTSFEFFDSGFVEKQAQREGVKILESIIRATPEILKSSDITPERETHITKAVSPIVKYAFPSAATVGQGQSFWTIGKFYKPDILIPRLKSAIEFKYASTEQCFITTVEQIHVDVEGYGGNPDYILFYAAFYVKAGVCSEERCQAIWDERRFPVNWKAIFVFGS